MSQEDFNRLEEIRKAQGYERASKAANEFVADATADKKAEEEQNRARELASAIEAYKAKQAEIAQVEERLALGARASRRRIRPPSFAVLL